MTASTSSICPTMRDLFSPDPAAVAARAASAETSRLDLYRIGCEMRRRRLRLHAGFGGLTFASAPHPDGRDCREVPDVPEDLVRLVRLHARRLRRLASVLHPDELTRLLCSLFAPLADGFELHPGVVVCDVARWRAAMLREVEQGSSGPRYRTGALGRDLAAVERVALTLATDRTPKAA
jgi:hypothetical protein